MVMTHQRGPAKDTFGRFDAISGNLKGIAVAAADLLLELERFLGPGDIYSPYCSADRLLMVGRMAELRNQLEYIGMFGPTGARALKCYGEFSPTRDQAPES
jgi:hypothetical protein